MFLRRAAIASILCGVWACGPRAEPATLAQGDTASAAGVAVTEGTGTPSAETVGGVGPRARVRYDLAAHVERAELFEGETRVIDLGALAGAKYTLGGWLTSVARDHDFDGTSAAIVDGSRGRFTVPWDGDGDAEITIRARVFGRGPLFAYVDDAIVGEAPVAPAQGFTTVRFSARGLERGEHTLLLRTGGTGAAPGVPRAGLAVDWIRVGPAGRANDTVPPAPATSVASHPALALDPDVTAGYALEVPEGARLRGVVDGHGELVVTARVDGEAPRALARVSGGSRAALDVDLAPLAGRVARIDLTATRASVRVIHPAIVTFDTAARPRPPRPKNVLLYLVDTLRADKLAPYDADTRVRTPGLGQFVRGAVTMGAAHAQENWTKPSVATLLSALMPWEHTAVQDASRVPQSVELLPEILSARGYYTGSFIANGYVSNAFGFDQGWGTYRNYIREGRRTEAEHVAHDVLAWLDARPTDKPFFLYVHTIDPHVPYRPPEETLALYEETPYRGALHFRDTASLLGDVKTGRVQMNADDRAHLEALYDGEITYHDTHFAAILDGLARREIDDETLVVVTADHGEEFFDHGSVGHGHNVFEELLHVPLFVRWPGVTDAGGRVETPVGLVDVLPTILDALGEPLPEGLSGRSMAASLLGEDESAPRYAVSGFMENWRTIVVGRTKLIHRTQSRAMLYDLVDDPGELRDVASERPIALRYTRGLLGIALAETRSDAPAPSQRARRPHRAESTAIDPELDAQLRALGYLR
jgi:arylsulfatase A-like enzyme